MLAGLRLHRCALGTSFYVTGGFLHPYLTPNAAMTLLVDVSRERLGRSLLSLCGSGDSTSPLAA